MRGDAAVPSPHQGSWAWTVPGPGDCICLPRTPPTQAGGWPGVRAFKAFRLVEGFVRALHSSSHRHDLGSVPGLQFLHLKNGNKWGFPSYPSAVALRIGSFTWNKVDSPLLGCSEWPQHSQGLGPGTLLESQAGASSSLVPHSEKQCRKPGMSQAAGLSSNLIAAL